MLETHTPRNALCPCGSGLKHKKCCLPKTEGQRFVRADRVAAWSRLQPFLEEDLAQEDDDAFDEFMGPHRDNPKELSEQDSGVSEQLFDLWFFFDRGLQDGRRPVERFLEEFGKNQSQGVRNYLQAMSSTSMRLYEVEDLRPGLWICFRDVMENNRVTVLERLGSKCVLKNDWVAARVIPKGASDQPEIEGIVPIVAPLRESLRQRLEDERARFLEHDALADLTPFYKGMAPLFHQAWLQSILHPWVPELSNTDGESLIASEVHFEVVERSALIEAISACPQIESSDDPPTSWQWIGNNAKGDATIMGSLRLGKATLILETNSVERAARGRALLEDAAATAIRHKATTHQDLEKAVRDHLESGDDANGPSQAEPQIPFEIQEALILDHMAMHYRRWLIEPVPALQGATPKDATNRSNLRPKLVELLQGLDNMYHRALKDGRPAFDPSWMWAELGLADSSPPLPPPLAHERIMELVPGSADLAKNLSKARRLQPHFDEATTLIGTDELRTNLDVQRLLRTTQNAFAHLETLINFELHHRKSFWVDEALAYTLSKTDFDVACGSLQLPFASFALVFTGRYVLSLAERWLSRTPDDPQAGHYLQALTVFIWKASEAAVPTLHLRFAMDAMGEAMPSLHDIALPLHDNHNLFEEVEKLAPVIAAQLQHATPLRGLMQVCLNAILYATSADIVPEPRKSSSGPKASRPDGQCLTSDEVFYLPGAIEISSIRHMQELDRHSDGRSMVSRFMVRGHWRRPAKDWSDQRLCWVRPYWKGPDMATIIERTYKLTGRSSSL